MKTTNPNTRICYVYYMSDLDNIELVILPFALSSICGEGSGTLFFKVIKTDIAYPLY